MQDYLVEQFELYKDRIAEIPQETMPEGRFADFFVSAAEYINYVIRVREELGGDGSYKGSEDLQVLNEKLFKGLYGEDYERSYANPDYADTVFGSYSKPLQFLAAELHMLPQLIYDGKDEELVILLELFIEIYCNFLAEEKPLIKTIEEAVYYWAFDYADIFAEDRIREIFVPQDNLPKRIVMEADLSDISYLYRYGERITDSEIRLAEFMNKLTEEEIESMASTFTGGFRRGFVTMNVDFDSRKTVSIRYFIGQERMVRAAVKKFEAMGLGVILSRYSVSRVMRKGIGKQGFVNLSAPRQFEYDHRMDDAIFFDRKFCDRKLSVIRAAYEKYADDISGYGGPAVIECFGEKDFEPVAKDTSITYTDKQQELSVYMSREEGMLREEFLPGDSYSFTIIAFPVPDIGDDFEAVFRETVNINTLDSSVWTKIHQHIIDAMDGAAYVKVEGSGSNRTDMKIIMRKLADPDRETQFENCVADVNIPLGEVFTSPVLKGSGGILHVSSVYINGLQFKNLSIGFEDGMVKSYTCDNFDDKEKCKAFIDDNILFHHKTLPLGEFAIGTNTFAYDMGRRFDIMAKLPILIMEKTGPHFAVGDTCYSHAEDTKVYNPDGKEIISRENDFSLLRDTEPEKAYFNCHTDITIPFDELGRLYAVYEDGNEVDIIRDGRFVLEGTEKLNEGIDGVK